MAVGLLVLTSGLAACSGGSDEDGARDAATALAGALAEGKGLDKVSWSGAEGAAVARDYDAVVAGMDGLTPTVEVGKVSTDGEKPSATLEWSWPVVEGGDAWTYETTAPLTQSGDAWSVTWSPALVEPSLAEGETLDVTTEAAQRGEITGAGGAKLVTERPVVRVGIDRTLVPAAQAPASARRLAALVGIDVAPYVKAVTGAGPKAFVEAITYRAAEIPAAVRAGLPGVTGSRSVDGQLALAPTRDFAAPILGKVGPVTAEMVKKDPATYRSGDTAGLTGLQARYDKQLRGTPGRAVYAVPATKGTERRELFLSEPAAGKPLATTLDTRLQTLAERILGGVTPASALVAIRPSDGSILAAANGAGTGGQNYATFGQFAPGSTFKSVTSLALLRAGLTPQTPVRCTPTVTVNGKSFKNYSDYPASAVGTIALQEAVAQSCNTALINARDKVKDGALADAAGSLGMGIDHDLGFPAYFGQVPAKPASETEGAANLIGQGKVLASPMAMATVVASIQAGKTVVPHLVAGADTSVPATAKPLTAAEARQLKALLRRVVTNGSGRGLAGLPGGPVIAKTGTAEYADGGTIRTHAWMIAAQDDLAVAVFVQTGTSGSQTAGPLLQEFLRGAR